VPLSVDPNVYGLNSSIDVPYRKEVERLETLVGCFAKLQTSEAVLWMTKCVNGHAVREALNPDFIPRRPVDVGGEYMEPHHSN
jgi:hypothetical protein